jgi:hypothetical protein
MFKSPFVNTAFNFTKRQFKRWPVVEAYDLLDYSVADKYADKYPYVWLKNKNIDIREDFDWSWSPPESEKHNVHCFPRALENKRPVDWNVLKLVSTNKNLRLSEIKQPLIASWHISDSLIVFYTFKKKVTSKKYINLSKKYPNTKLVADANTLEDVIKSVNCISKIKTFYFINIDVDIDQNFDFMYKSQSDLINYFRVDHYSNSYSYEDGSFVCLNRSCLQTIHNNRYDFKKFVTAKTETAGILNDYQNPEDCWINAYKISVKLNSDFIKPKTHKNKILTELISNNVNRLDDYLKDGVEVGLTDYEDQGDLLLSKIENYDYCKQRFKDRQQQRQIQILNPRATAARMKAMHGEDSDEYLNALKSI